MDNKLRVEQQNVRMYGMRDMKAFEQSVRGSITWRVGGKEMFVISLLSDAQHELSVGLEESARMTINRAKYVLMLDKE